MSQQSYLIDTNILIGLEDNRAVEPAYSRFLSLAAKHKVGVYVHEAALDDISRDRDSTRRRISLSKINKYLLLAKRRALTRDELEKQFGSLRKNNDIVDATLLHALKIDAADFLVTQDRGLHERAQKHSPDLARRVLFVGDAAELLAQTYEPRTVPIRHVAEVPAHTIDYEDAFFDSLRDGYGPYFNNWWKERCVKQRRPCWVVYDNDKLAGLIVRKDETAKDTDAVTKAPRILKICTFKVSPDKRGVKLGELLLKQVLWFSQTNKYDLAYITTYKDQAALINLLDYYGFQLAGYKADGELIYERSFSSAQLLRTAGESTFDSARKNYPRFLTDGVRAFAVPIKENYHDTLYPDLWNPRQADLFLGSSRAEAASRPGNTIRKVYLCRAQSSLAEAGSILFFYKSSSKEPPSQAMTALGILEEVTWATSTKELMLKTGGRSVYSEIELEAWKATTERPVKVINYLLVGYIQPSVSLAELRDIGVIKGNPPQSIYEIPDYHLQKLLKRSRLGFSI